VEEGEGEVERDIEGEDVGNVVDEVGDELVLGVAEVDEEVTVGRAIFHPLTAIAPTVESCFKVVVTIVHEVDSPLGVDPNVRTAPGCTVDKQSPFTWPAS